MAPLPRRSKRVQECSKEKKVQTQTVIRSFAEVTKGRAIIGFINNGSKDGLSPNELWRMLVNKPMGAS